MAAVLLLRHGNGPFEHFQGYRGDAVCAQCHTQETLSWAITHHANAYVTLYSRDRAEDLECVGCHVTGLGQEGGFEMGDHRSPFNAVGCESCHGPSGPHDGQRQEALSTCRSCHDAEHSIAFSEAKGLPLIDHFVANEMDTDELLARIYEISSGQAPRPLLAFEEAQTVGAEVCRSCHRSQHRRMRRGGHATAMRWLVGDDAENTKCVQCHATPMKTGPPSEEISGWRVDEGVGCEACHGPGGAHVASPTSDNIVGLGESCPECVIEALCTRCHTPQWDPMWDLKRGLSGIPH